MVINCNNIKEKVTSHVDFESNNGAFLHQSDIQTTHIFVYTWSYTTSSDPALPGRSSDVFVGKAKFLSVGFIS